MYEHLRNELLMELQPHFDSSTIDLILNKLDKVSADYEIAEKVTSLAVIEDDIPRIVKTYLASKKLEGATDSTIDNYGTVLKVFFGELRKDVQDIETNEIRLFLATYQMNNGVSNRTLDKYHQVLNAFFTWCTDEEYLVKNPCRNIKEIKYEAKQRHSLTRFQLERLRRACHTKRELAIVDVLYSTGCRVSELINMKFSDVNEPEHSIGIIGKGRKHNTVYLNDNAQISLGDYLKERQGDSEYIFVSDRKPHGKLSVRAVEVLIKTLGKEIGVETLSPHILRHTSATLALQSGMPLTQVQKMLGHSSPNTTQIYAETSQSDIATSHQRYVV